jgi:glutamine cyclotransferase
MAPWIDDRLRALGASLVLTISICASGCGSGPGTSQTPTPATGTSRTGAATLAATPGDTASPTSPTGAATRAITPPTTPTTTPAPTPAGSATTFGYEVVGSWPHDPTAFTEGLAFDAGTLLESAGRSGPSALRRVELTTGKVLEKVEVPGTYSPEGLTVLDGKVYLVTWQQHTGFIYDAASLQKLGEFSYDGEGWGLTNDGRSLILSDGTDQLRSIDPKTFEVRRTIGVKDAGGQPITGLNELESVKGEIYANVWHDDRIARIEPTTGSLLGWIDLAGLLAPDQVSDEEAVMNGIAYDPAGDRLFVTGKLWPRLFQIRVRASP